MVIPIVVTALLVMSNLVSRSNDILFLSNRKTEEQSFCTNNNNYNQ